MRHADPALDHYAVMGNPISHSKSPHIHGLFAQQTGQSLEYRAIHVELGGFATALSQFRDRGGRGLNITVPFKPEAHGWVDRLNPRAQQAGAVNTIIFQADGSSVGDNTDGVGLVRDLVNNHGAHLAGQRILLLGAGGAAQGVIPALLEAQPDTLIIANRTSSKAKALAKHYSDLGRVQGSGLADLASAGFDMIINATAAGLQGELPELPPGLLAPWCYDLVYGDQPTAFVRWAQQQGALNALDGLGMLVEQAAESFYLWRGVRPDTAPVIDALRKFR